MKTCIICDKIKPLIEFKKSYLVSLDGYTNQCLECLKQKRKAHEKNPLVRLKINEYSKSRNRRIRGYTGPLTLKERFEKSYFIEPNTGCWIWALMTNKSGYGVIRVDHKTCLAHRTSYEIYKEQIPKGLCVCHRCDNPICVNPAHLFIGTLLENIKDRDQKQRVQRGSRHVSAKLTEIHIPIIREASYLGFKNSEIRKYFRISQSALRQVIKKETWKHI